MFHQMFVIWHMMLRLLALSQLLVELAEGVHPGGHGQLVVEGDHDGGLRVEGVHGGGLGVVGPVLGWANGAGSQ